jgi:hypothetical protein
MRNPIKKTAEYLITTKKTEHKPINSSLLQSLNSAGIVMSSGADTIQAITGYLTECERTKQVSAVCEMEIVRAQEQTSQIKEVSTVKKEEIQHHENVDLRRHIEVMANLKLRERQQIHDINSQLAPTKNFLDEYEAEKINLIPLINQSKQK